MLKQPAKFPLESSFASLCEYIALLRSGIQTVAEDVDTKASSGDPAAHTGDTGNPHNVTKDQVGLGNVPNVATNDQKPTYTAASTLSALSSGEKLSTAFGKIVKALSDLITHLSDTTKHITAAERTSWNGKTSNTGTVTKVSTGAGLTGGDITGTGTVKANLLSETKLANAAAAATETSGRVYPVALDKNGKMAVNVPWTDTNTQTLTGVKGNAETSYRTGDVNLTPANIGAAASGHTHNYAGSSSAGGSATSAEKLTTARNIDGVSFDGSAEIIHFGTCSIAASTAAKTVTCTGFALVTGARIAVKFANANTAASPTLNVNSTGAKSIVKYGTTASMAYMWQAGEVVEFFYDGTNYVMLQGGLATTTYYGLVKLSSATNSTSTALAATASAVKAAYDLAKGKQSPATTLAGYGITDAYTKAEIDAMLANVITKR